MRASSAVWAEAITIKSGSEVAIIEAASAMISPVVMEDPPEGFIDPMRWLKVTPTSPRPGEDDEGRDRVQHAGQDSPD